MSGGQKHDNGKPPISLIPGIALELAAEALAYGAVKYSADNYKLGLKYRRLLDAALRHLLKFSDGEDFDKESGIHHIGHAIATLSMLTYQMQNHSNLDDRFKVPKPRIPSSLPAGIFISDASGSVVAQNPPKKGTKC